MRPELFMRLAQIRVFWQIRALIQRLEFRILSRVFRVKYLVQEEQSNTRILLEFTKLAIWQLLVAVGVTIGIQVIELLLADKLIKYWPSPEPQSYTNWLGSVAQIGGVFIALYFTAVAAAAGAIYAQVPNNVRDLLARERVGNIYIRYLTFATFIPLCFIALQLLGFAPIRLAVPAVVFTAGVGIIAFAKLGQRAFNLFDPTRLADSLFADLGRWIEQVRPGGFRWLDPAFQKHAHRQAVTILDTFDTLVDISATRANLDSRPLLDLTIKILHFLTHYQDRKLAIPTASLWFEQKYEHKDWYQTPDTTVQIAHQTGTLLSPDSVSDHDWLENRLELVSVKCFEVNVRRNRLNNVLEFLDAFGHYTTARGTTGEARHATTLVKNLQNVFDQASAGIEKANTPCTNQLKRVAITDRLGLLQVQILTSYRKGLEERTPEATKNRLNNIQWHKAKSIYRSGFLVEELRQLEWLLPRVQLEVSVEGKVITPTWYAQALLSKSQAEMLSDNLDCLLGEGDNVFQVWSGQLIKAGHFWEAAAVQCRFLEYLNKLETYHLAWFKKYFEMLQSARYLSDLKWPEVKPELWIEQARKSREALIKSLAAQIVLLLRIERPEGTPDYLGQFIHTVGEALFEALLQQRDTEVAALSGPYFAGNLGLFEKLKPKDPKLDIWTERQLQVAAAPIIDLMELSGYAKLLAELHNKSELWAHIQNVWDSFIQGQPNALKWLSAIVIGGEPTGQLPHRGLVRTTWGIRVQAKLNELQRRRVVEGHASYGGPIIEETVVHPSALVRHSAKLRFQGGKEIFAALYLSTRPDGQGLDWGWAARDLVESLKSQEKWYCDHVEQANAKE